MNRVKTVVFTLFIALSLISRTYAQSKDEKKGDEIFQHCHYYEAIDYFKNALDKETDRKVKPKLMFKVAQCYKMMKDSKNAEIWYKKAMLANCPIHQATLFYADMLLANGKVDEASAQYTAYLALEPSDAPGVNGVETCKRATQWKSAPAAFDVINCTSLNSKDDDYAPCFYNLKYNSLAFTSSREGAVGEYYNQVNGQSSPDIYTSTADKNGKWSLPASAGKNINTKNGEADASVYFSDRSATATPSEIYFTRSIIEKDKKQISHIYVAKLKSGSTTDWDTPTLINIAGDTINCCNPCISTDGLTLYFSSDMPGGQGGMDIWMVKCSDKNAAWGEPVNLGKTINTAGDEVYPYATAGNDTLYFSSNGLPGMGGLDIFMSVKKGGSWSTPVNLQSPINSSSDDFGIIFQNSKKGYFCSSRPGGKGNVDIYMFSPAQQH
jgi:peptidoglycan-associated lipoprotein